MQSHHPDETEVRRIPVPLGDLVLRSPPNWTAVGFLGLIGGLHLIFACSSFAAGRWEGYMSVIFGALFVSAAAVCSRFRLELAVLGSRSVVRVRHGVGRYSFERIIPFSAFHGVRLTLTGASKRTFWNRIESRIELLSRLDDIECPPTRIPRQEALFIAMAMDVPLIKVSEERA